MPVYTALFGLFMFSSIGLPGLSGFIGEFLAILAAFRVPEFRVLGIISMLVIILAAVYMMWMFQRVAFGEENKNVAGFPDVTRAELATLAPLVVLTIVFGVYPGPLFEVLHPPVEQLLRLVPATVAALPIQ